MKIIPRPGAETPPSAAELAGSETTGPAATAGPAAPAAASSCSSGPPRAPRLRTALWVLVLLVTAGTRLPAALAGRPYISYVDEGNYLHRVIHLLAGNGWDTGWYLYPTVPMYSVEGAALLYDPVYRGLHGHSLRRDLSPDPPLAHDVLEPPEILYLGRALAILLSLGVVVLAGALAGRLAGPQAGLLAAWLAALTPALVIRGGVANVDVYAAFFVLAALVAAERLRGLGDAAGRTGAAWGAGVAGAMVGLAAVSKYTDALVCLPVALAILFGFPGWGRKLRLLALAGLCAVLAAVLAMPGLVLRTGQVLRDLHTQHHLYSILQIGSYREQAFERAEWDQPLEAPELGAAYVALAALGLLVSFGERRLARATAGWLLFGGAFGLLLAPYNFRAFRNLLPLVPLLAVLTAFVYARLRRAAAGRTGLRWVTDLAAVALPLALFAPAIYVYDAERLQVEDSRTAALRWLAAHVNPGDPVLVSFELMFLPSELATLPAQVSVRTWPTWRQAMRGRANRFVVLGNFALPGPQGPRPIPPRAWSAINDRYELKATFGQRSVLASDSYFNSRGNFQPIFLLERRGPPP